MEQGLLKKITAYTSALILFLCYKPGPDPSTKGTKILFLDIRKNYFKRYLYLLLKFFHQEGYVIHLPFRLKLIRDINSDPYASLLFREKIVNFGRPAAPGNFITLSDQVISPDYFCATIKQTPDRPTFFIPMAQHPIMYHAGFWNAPVRTILRKKSVFMAGNFDPGAYDTLEKDGLFNVMSRISVFSYLEQSKMLFPINNKPELDSFFRDPDDHKVILVNRLIFDIPMKELRQVLSQFDFFFALPGIVMPLAHNVVEAMSVGTIPFIQEEYAKLLHPPLYHGREAFFFKDHRDLQGRLEQLLSMPEEEIRKMRNNVFKYYHEHLTPSAVIQKLEKANYPDICLQAEHYSVELIKKAKVSEGGPSDTFAGLI